jgi:predicted component of type VI protein secretion system
MEHIKRFGPAILFATEAFESFNAIIRAKSVHSNRHAPSQDIAQAFAQGNRVCHLLSSGRFQVKSGSVVAPQGLSWDASTWLSAGPGPLSLVAKPSTVTQYLGLNYQAPAKHSMLVGNYCKWNTVVFSH